MIQKKAFTLLEIMIIVMLMSFLLGSTVFLGWAYVITMQVKTEKQSFIGIYNEFTAEARTSNYSEGSRYDDMTISIEDGRIVGDVALTAGGNLEIGEYIFESAGMVFTGSDSGGSIDVTIEPYKIGCNQIRISSTSSVASGVDLQLVSSINDDVYCFAIDDRTCKMTQQLCD